MTFCTPNKDTMCVWRRVCTRTPFSASTSTTAASAVEAPVAMLRVYCSWPGQSATMNLRLRRREIAIRHVDGDALLAFGLQAVDQQRQVRHFAGGAPAAAVVGDGRELVVEHLAGVVQQSADERALAVVDAAAGDEAQQVDVALLREELFQGARRFGHGRGDVCQRGGHQKYPSRLRFSIAAADSASMARLWRSDVVVRSISSMMAGTVSAFDTCAPVSG